MKNQKTKFETPDFKQNIFSEQPKSPSDISEKTVVPFKIDESGNSIESLKDKAIVSPDIDFKMVKLDNNLAQPKESAEAKPPVLEQQVDSPSNDQSTVRHIHSSLPDFSCQEMKKDDSDT